MYYKVYDFTNENVSCLKYLYHFKNSKVLSVVGSGDHFFASVLNDAKKIDLFDINPTSYLHFILKFYSIRELTYEEFYSLMVLKEFDNVNIYLKLESVLPIEVLKYYKYLINLNINKKNKNKVYRDDGIDLLMRKNKKYYFHNERTVIPYFIKENYYKLQEKLKNMNLPNYFEGNIIDLKPKNYDIILMSNIYDRLRLNIDEYTEMLKKFDSYEIQAYYDWHGSRFELFNDKNYFVDRVLPSSPWEYSKEPNYIYSLKK